LISTEKIASRELTQGCCRGKWERNLLTKQERGGGRSTLGETVICEPQGSRASNGGQDFGLGRHPRRKGVFYVSPPKEKTPLTSVLAASYLTRGGKGKGSKPNLSRKGSSSKLLSGSQMAAVGKTGGAHTTKVQCGKKVNTASPLFGARFCGRTEIGRKGRPWSRDGAALPVRILSMRAGLGQPCKRPEEGTRELLSSYERRALFFRRRG